MTFSFRSHQSGKQEKLRGSVENFVLRIAQHIPMPGKSMVRYSGLYASGSRKRLNAARKILDQNSVSEKEVLDWQSYLNRKGFAPTCEVCGLPLFHKEEVVSKVD